MYEVECVEKEKPHRHVTKAAPWKEGQGLAVYEVECVEKENPHRHVTEAAAWKKGEGVDSTPVNIYRY